MSELKLDPIKVKSGIVNWEATADEVKALREDWLTFSELLSSMKRERDAYKKAKEENDERFMQAAHDWQTLFGNLAVKLKCLPSVFTDANQHVFEAADALISRRGAALEQVKVAREALEKVREHIQKTPPSIRDYSWSVQEADRYARQALSSLAGATLSKGGKG